MSKPTLTVTSDRTKEILMTLKKFKKDPVLVGIPQSDTKRKEDEPIGNAALLFINNFGSPANNIPPRPVMEIGIKVAKEQIAAEFKKAIIEGLSKGVGALNTYYNRAGMIASNSIKKVINDQIGIDEPAESTIAGRVSRGFKGTKALIVTGQMRNAITWVVKE